MTEKLFNALKAIETLASDAVKVYGLPLGQSLDRRNDMAISFRGPGPGHRAVHKPSKYPQLRLLLLKVYKPTFIATR